MTAPLIALDADGVLVDYHIGYATAWKLAFGETLQVRDPQGYHPMHYWDVPLLSRVEQEHLATNGFTEEVWRTMPALPGAIQACELMQAMGFRLQCVTALPPHRRAAREANLAGLGFRLDTVHAVGPRPWERSVERPRNPKQAIITSLAPDYFVDDCLHFFQGIPPGVWRALIDVRPNNSPNHDPALEPAHSHHGSLLAFARWLEKTAPARTNNAA